MAYQPRVVDAELTAALDAVGAVLIEGPSACGKSETARQAAQSEVRLDVDEDARLAAATDPALVLPGEAPRLIDEWRPMTLSEAGHSTDAVSFRSLLAGESVRAGDTGHTIDCVRWLENVATPVSIKSIRDDVNGADGNMKLRVHAQAVDAQAFAYRDETGLEADAVIETAEGGWAAFEVKLGQREVDSAADQLLRLRDRVDTGDVGDPLALVVVTATGYGYVRKDGVAVVPFGALTL